MAPSDHTSVTGTLRLDQQDHRSTSSLHRTFQSGLPARTHTTIHTVSEDFLNYKLPLSTQQDFLQGHTQPCTLSVKTSWTINCLSQPSRTSCKDTHNHSHCQWRLLELWTASLNPEGLPARTYTTMHTVSEDFLNYKLPLSTQQDLLQGHTQPFALSVKTSWTIHCLSQPSKHFSMLYVHTLFHDPVTC